MDWGRLKLSWLTVKLQTPIKFISSIHDISMKQHLYMDHVTTAHASQHLAHTIVICDTY